MRKIRIKQMIKQLSLLKLGPRGPERILLIFLLGNSRKEKIK